MYGSALRRRATTMGMSTGAPLAGGPATNPVQSNQEVPPQPPPTVIGQAFSSPNNSGKYTGNALLPPQNTGPLPPSGNPSPFVGQPKVMPPTMPQPPVVNLNAGPAQGQVNLGMNSNNIQTAAHRAQNANKHQHSGSGGSGSGGGSGGKKHHKLSAIQKYLAGDETYQYQLNQLVKQLQDFNTQNYAQRANVNEDFNNALGKMNNQKGLDMKSMMNDYAARGMLNSGLYLGSVGDYNKNYQQNVNDLSTDQQRSLDDLINALQQYHQENSASRHNARLEAIRRRAQQYGIKS